MNRMKLHVILLALLICLVPNAAFADNTEIQASVTVINNKITDLAVSQPNYSTLTLSWTSPQSSPPNWGPAKQYDIRYSKSPITTEAEWQAAAQLANPPIPQPPGSPETLLVIGLNPCTTYYFAIKAADAAGTWTPLSNSPQGTTLCYSGGGGGIGGLPAAYTACPLTLTVNMQGEITTVGMTKDGVLCATCLAKSPSGDHTLQMNKDAKVILADNTVPLLLRFSETSTKPPTPENTVIVGPVYELNAYSSPYATTPSPITISPPATLILSYEPDELPENTSEVFIANYHTEEGWRALASPAGITAEVGKANAQLSHFSLFAVLANIEEPVPAEFEMSNLTVSPSQAQLDQEVTISVNVANNSNTALDYNVQLKVDGIVKSSKLVTVAAGTSQTVNFTVSGDAVGRHQIEVAGLIGEFEVVVPAGQSAINWWLISSIIGIIIVVAMWSIIGWRYYKYRKQQKKITETPDKQIHKSK